MQSKRRTNQLTTLLLAGLIAGFAPTTLALAQEPTGPQPNPTGGQPALPEGHPDIEEMMRQQREGEHAAARGSLAVRAVQGTPGASDVGTCDVTIEFYRQNQLIDQVDGQLDEHGVAVFNDVPVGPDVIPVARVEYAGVTYLDRGRPMDPRSPSQTVEITVYEITEAEPDWHVEERHLMVHRQPEAIVVRELVQVVNPSDQTWFGIPDGSGKGDAARITLPLSATDVNLGSGFHGWCCTKFDESTGTLINQMPMMPGASRYQFEYTLPFREGGTNLEINSPKETHQLAVYVPEDGTQVEPVGLESGGTQKFGDVEVRLFGATALTPDDSIMLQFKGVTTAGELAATRAATGNVKWLTGLGVGVLVIVGLVLIFMKPRSASDGEGEGEAELRTSPGAS